MKKIHLIIALLVIVYSCHSTHEKINENYPKVIPLNNWDTIAYITKPVINAVSIEIFDSVLIIQQALSDYHFLLFDVKSKRILKRWGTKGRGPNEFVNISNSYINNGMLEFLHSTSKSLVKTSINEILYSKNSTVYSIKVPYTSEFRTFKLYTLQKNKIVLGASSKGRIGLLDNNNHILSTFGNYPIKEKNIPNLYKYVALQGKVVTNVPKNRFCSILYNTDFIDIYEVNNNQPYNLWTSNYQYIPPVIKRGRSVYTIDSQKAIGGFLNIKANEEQIFALFSDKSAKEVSQNGRTSNEIICFDWDGKKIVKYISDIPLYHLAADNQFLYSMQEDEEKTYILKHLLK